MIQPCSLFSELSTLHRLGLTKLLLRANGFVDERLKPLLIYGIFF